MFVILVIAFFIGLSTGNVNLNLGLDFVGGYKISLVEWQGGSETEIYAALGDLSGVNVKETTSFTGTRILDITLKSGSNSLTKQQFEEKVMSALNLKEKPHAKEIDSYLGKILYEKTTRILLFSFLLMGGAVFFYFRSVVPSVMAVSCVLIDVIETFIIASFLGVEINTSTIIAFMFVFGYSINTDVLLTTKLMKMREGTIFASIKSAAKIGLTMQITSWCAFLAIQLVSTNDIARTIALIMNIAIAFDIINTWIINTGILRWYLEKKEASV
ncbi:MAG: hypothetical protein COW47_01165 [Candidatus Huberarchaeum crystalense]|uniref:Protein export membrane protein SecD/SecF C-terminal domain-containing protein n=1 Tax=Huberarchaeum crystalense TaxID=2014257 RepID=A0A2H9MMG4_HUBC1|nr:MAG: hypothetical protein COW47_01165 [Candidatus Huberarchaeum crystalense]